MSDMKTTLPEAADMLERLKGVSDEPDLVEHFYPLIQQYAGQSRYGLDVLYQLQLAIVDYTDGAPLKGALLLKEVPRYLEALIDDEVAREEALSVYKEAPQE